MTVEMVLSWMVTMTMVTGLTTGMMRPTMKTMGMINTIKTTSLGFLLITSLEHHWPNRQQIHRHIILRPQYHCYKQEDDIYITLTPHSSTPLVDLLTRIRSPNHSTFSSTLHSSPSHHNSILASAPTETLPTHTRIVISKEIWIVEWY